MDRRFKTKVWKDRLASAFPAKWSWEVVERTGTQRVLGCGTTFSQRESQAAAERLIARRVDDLEQRRPAYGLR